MTAAFDQWVRDAAAPFEGWDFAYLKDRMTEAEPAWDYPALARAALGRAAEALDIATGGGEVLASFAPFTGRVTAVEGYPPNVPVARPPLAPRLDFGLWLHPPGTPPPLLPPRRQLHAQPVARRRLAPLGVAVHQANTRSGMPFPDQSFDLVLNRHGGFRPAEMHRILKPGGVFLSQQVAGDNLADLCAHFDAPLVAPHNTLDQIARQFADLGCEIRRGEAWRGSVAFADVGAIVYFLKAVPWVVQGFDLDRHRAALEALHARVEAGQPLAFTYTRFLIEAVRR